MPSDSGEPRRLTKPGAPPPEQEHLPCPRCDSTNTKFCYYNNYNFSQPRHFCKSCRRYWTHGGTLRDIPVGGGTRKNAKRSRTCSSVATATVIGMGPVTNTASENLPLPATPLLVPFSAVGGSVQFSGGDVKGGTTVGGSFTSLLNTQGPGYLALGGFGLGLDEVGLGLGRGVWAFPGLGDNAASGTMTAIGNAWQFESGENGFIGGGGSGGDCFSWPDLAISTAGNGLK